MGKMEVQPMNEKNILSYTDFFSIEHFSHKALFEKAASVFDVLNDLETYLKEICRERIEVEIPPMVHLENRSQIVIEKGTIIEPQVFIRGPCYIGKNCHIRQGAYLRGSILTGEGCVLGHGTEIKNTVLLSKVSLAHLSYIGDSILGNSVNLGAGVLLANLRLDRKEIFLKKDKNIFPTGRTKLGAILGDKVQLGCNCTLNPGTVMGKNTVAYPGLNLSGFYPENVLIKRKEELFIEKRK
jgi:UDP-N-acetylglucosamine diphosphorylase / glucose-1-phosphate thymidylyltransferase / UDP-N-acetylgalactosamine diphosphorylase / glucosamine-1-phosphate N-acetyltransferase / galactosamine-1-phosphate N-acetyltransferase